MNEPIRAGEPITQVNQDRFWDELTDWDPPDAVIERGRRVVRGELMENYGGETGEVIARRVRLAQGAARMFHREGRSR